MELNQYQIILVNLDPTIGSEINKTRPCLIVSPNEMNKHLKTIIIAPITSNPRKYPSRVQLKRESKTRSIVLDQIRTIDKKRVVTIYESISTKQIQEVKSTFKKMFVD